MTGISVVDTFLDGLWHSVIIDVLSGTADRVGKVNVTVDGYPEVSERQINFLTTSDFYIGGNARQGTGISMVYEVTEGKAWYIFDIVYRECPM